MLSDSCIQGKPLLVTIIGGAGAGKSQLAKATVAELGEDVAARVPTDYFLAPRDPDESLQSFLMRPLRYDWALLEALFRLPIGTRTSTPDVDFEKFQRRNSTGGLPLVVRPVMISDAMLPFPGADLVVRVEVPEEVRFARVVERDHRWGTRVQDRWAHLEATWNNPADTPVDMVLDGTMALSQNAARLGARIITRLG